MAVPLSQTAPALISREIYSRPQRLLTPRQSFRTVVVVITDRSLQPLGRPAVPSAWVRPVRDVCGVGDDPERTEMASHVAHIVGVRRHRPAAAATCSILPSPPLALRM